MMNLNLNDNLNIEPKNGPLVLLLLDGFGVAAISEANAMSLAKTPTLDDLIKEYPVALLSTPNKNLNVRYLSLGAGCDLADENLEPQVNLTKILSANGLMQIKITETERLAALTHFFNSHVETRLAQEDWKIISSETVDNKLKPALVLNRLSNELIKQVEADKYNVLIASFPTIDLVASTGDLKNVKKIIEALDKKLKKIVSSILSKKGVLIISAACGNAEQMKNMATDLLDKEMTNNPVPLIIIGDEFRGKTIGLIDPVGNDLSLLAPSGTLADIAPTMLKILGLEKPGEMTGESLI